jgi:hypothetical protein
MPWDAYFSLFNQKYFLRKAVFLVAAGFPGFFEDIFKKSGIPFGSFFPGFLSVF